MWFSYLENLGQLIKKNKKPSQNEQVKFTISQTSSNTGFTGAFERSYLKCRFPYIDPNLPKVLFYSKLALLFSPTATTLKYFPPSSNLPTQSRNKKNRSLNASKQITYF